MELLQPSDFTGVIPLVEASGMRSHLALVYEVLDGRLPGQVWADDTAHPNTALVCNDNGFFFAFGRPDEALARPLLEDFWYQPRMREINAGLFGSSPAWKEPLNRILAPLGAESTSRIGFELRASPPAPAVPPGFALQPITVEVAQAINDGTGTGGFGLDPWYIRIEGGPQAYAAQRLGLVLVRDGLIASMAGFCGLARQEAELEVGTVAVLRGHGLAQVVTAAFIRQCLERGLTPAYSCTRNNSPSVAVARRLGYEEIEEIPGFKMYL